VVATDPQELMSPLGLIAALVTAIHDEGDGAILCE